MDEIEILLKEEIGPDLGSRQEIEKLFNNIDKNTSKVIMNFEDIEFMGRSFAQEYLNQKNNAQFKVIEKNMHQEIKKMFDVILKLNNRI